MEVSFDITSLKIIEYINRRILRELYKSKYLGLLSPRKEIDIVFDVYFDKKVSILGSLSQLKIIKYFCALKDILNNIDMKKNRKSYLTMELMQTSLSNMLEEKRPISYIFVIDIMHQIARDAHYLYNL